MQVNEALARQMLVEMGSESSGSPQTCSSAKLQGRLNGILDDPDLKEPASADCQGLFASIKVALESGESITLAEEEDVSANGEDVQTEAKPKKKGKKAPKKAPVAGKGKPAKKEKAPKKTFVKKGKDKPAAAHTNGAPQRGREGSLLSAAYKVLKATNNKPRSVRELVELAEKKGLWTPTSGKTPHQSLSSSLQVELKKKGKDSRFVRTGPGLWALAK